MIPHVQGVRAVVVNEVVTDRRGDGGRELLVPAVFVAAGAGSF